LILFSTKIVDWLFKFAMNRGSSGTMDGGKKRVPETPSNFGLI